MKTRVRSLFAVATPFALSLLVTISARQWWFSRTQATTSLQDAASAWGSEERVGPELLLVVITSTSCAACKDPRLPVLLERVDQALREEAEGRQWRYASLGIAESPAAREGMEYIERFRFLDEVIAGHRWLNTGLLKYVTSDFPGPMATPQIAIVIRRTTSYGIEGGSEHILLRKLGAAEINEWLERGGDLPVVVE